MIETVNQDKENQDKSELPFPRHLDETGHLIWASCPWSDIAGSQASGRR